MESATGDGERCPREGVKLSARRAERGGLHLPRREREQRRRWREMKMTTMAAASVAPVRAVSCVRARAISAMRPAPLELRVRALAGMERELKPMAAASFTPLRAVSCARALSNAMRRTGT